MDCEEEKEEMSSSWSEWGPCIQGVQERIKCMGEEYGCEVEDQVCDSKEVGMLTVKNEALDILDEKSEKKKGAVLVGWEEWSACLQGYQTRSKCSEVTQASILCIWSTCPKS